MFSLLFFIKLFPEKYFLNKFVEHSYLILIKEREENGDFLV